MLKLHELWLLKYKYFLVFYDSEQNICKQFACAKFILSFGKLWQAFS